MNFIIRIKTESHCAVKVDAKDIFEAVDIIQNGDFINDSRCSNYTHVGIIQNINGIEDEHGKDILRIIKYMKP